VQAILPAGTVDFFHRDGCLYFRKEATVSIKSGEEVTAWTYVFADPESIADRPRLVVDVINGDPLDP
jgi:hypothetical protein